MSWLANSMGSLSVRVTSLPVHKSLPASGPLRPSLARLRREGVSGDAVGADVEYGDCHCSTGEMAGPDFDFAVGIGAASLMAELVLIDGDDIFVGEDGLDLRLHVGQVIAGEKRRGEHGPHGEVVAIFSQCEPAVANLEHVGIVPVAGAGVFGEACILIDDVDDAHPVGPDVAGGAPEVAAERRSPLPRSVQAVLAKGVNDGAAGGLEGFAHLDVGGD